MELRQELFKHLKLLQEQEHRIHAKLELNYPRLIQIKSDIREAKYMLHDLLTRQEPTKLKK